MFSNRNKKALLNSSNIKRQEFIIKCQLNNELNSMISKKFHSLNHHMRKSRHVVITSSNPQERRKNKLFEQVKEDMRKRSVRLIEQEQKNFETGGEYSQIELYVDQDRCAAVVIGSEDIKSEMAKFQEKTGKHKVVIDSLSYYKEGRNQMKHKEYEKAINSLTKAHEISDDVNDESFVLERSSCHLKLGNFKKALLDVSIVFRILVRKSQVMIEDMMTSNANKNTPSQESINQIHDQAKNAIKDSFVKATHFKADALFGLGNFEYALIHYMRLQKLRSSSLHFRGLIDRCTIAIKNSIGKRHQLFTDKESTQCIQELVANRVHVNECYFIENNISKAKFRERKIYQDYSTNDFERGLGYTYIIPGFTEERSSDINSINEDSKNDEKSNRNEKVNQLTRSRLKQNRRNKSMMEKDLLFIRRLKKTCACDIPEGSRFNTKLNEIQDYIKDRKDFWTTFNQN